MSKKSSSLAGAQPPASGAPLTVKQQREQRRQEKVAEFQRLQAKQKRNQRFGWIAAIVGGIAVVGLLVTVIVVNGRPPVDPDTITVEGIETFPNLDAVHVEGTVAYAMTPPAGGPHNARWLTCGVYSQPVPNENAVHSLEHGAVWLTYDPALVSESDISTLRGLLPRTHSIISPYSGMDTPIAISSWGRQLKVDEASDERLADFVTKYWRAADVPEPGASCSNGVVGDGFVA